VIQPARDDQLEFESSESKSSNNSVKQGWLLLGMGVGVVITWGVTTIFSPQTITTKDNPVEMTYVNPSVKTAKVETTEILRTLQTNGTVAPLKLIPVSSQIVGREITEILVEEGEWVEKGQLLARLDNSQLQSQISEKQALVAEARAHLAQLETAASGEDITKAEENLKNAQNSVTKAESDLKLVETRAERDRQLATEGAISQEQLSETLNDVNNQQSSLEQAQAYLLESQNKLTELTQGKNQKVIVQAQAQLAQAQSELNLLQNQLKETAITAPVRGKIAQKNIQVGDITNTQTQLFQIIEGGRLQVELQVPESLVQEVQPGQIVKIDTNNPKGNLSTVTGKNILGTVREINPQIDEISRQAIIKVDLPAEAKLQPGMLLSAAIVTETVSVLTIPTTAVLPKSNSIGIVYVIENEKLKPKKVEIGEILPEARIEIKNGLQQSDIVVIDGVNYRRQGDRQKVL